MWSSQGSGSVASNTQLSDTCVVILTSYSVLDQLKIRRGKEYTHLLSHNAACCLLLRMNRYTQKLGPTGDTYMSNFQKIWIGLKHALICTPDSLPCLAPNVAQMKQPLLKQSVCMQAIQKALDPRQKKKKIVWLGTTAHTYFTIGLSVWHCP